MAFSEAQLTKVHTLKPASGQQNERGLWFYAEAATLAAIAAAGYFNDMRGKLQVGDQIIVRATDGLGHLEVAAAPETGNVTTTVVRGASKIVQGQHITVAAVDTIVTGLSAVAGVIAVLDDDPVDGVMQVTASIGNQAGAPAAGSIYIKGWKSTDADASQVAATTFGKKVNWVAWGLV